MNEFSWISLDRGTSPQQLTEVLNVRMKQLLGALGDKQSRIRILTPQMFGAKGTLLRDDTVAIQKTIDAGADSNLPVFIPPPPVGYLLNGERQSSYRSGGVLIADTLLVIPDGLTMFGLGYNSLFKVADDYTDAGDYRVMGPAAAVTNNVLISGIRIDGNGENNLVLDSGANVRRGYPINLLAGANCHIHKCWFTNSPGRNLVNMGNNSATYDFTDSSITYCTAKDSAGAIIGNGKQNDHSSFYLQGERCLVHGNNLSNTVQPDPFTTPAKTINALEMHCKDSVISENTIYNYTGGAIDVAQVHDSKNNLWVNNHWINCTSNVFVIVSAGGFTNEGCTIQGGSIGTDNITYSGGTVVYQNSTTAITSTAVKRFKMDGVYVYATNTTPLAKVTYGALFRALDGFEIVNCTFENTQASGLAFEGDSTTELSIRNGLIDNNTFINCGIHTNVTRPWMLYFGNAATDAREFANIKVGKNNRFIRNLSTVLTPRGIRVTGDATGVGGHMNNISIEMPEFEGIQRAQRIDFANITNFRDVYVIPRTVMHARASDPTSGHWQANPLCEVVKHSDPVTAGFIGKVPVASGTAVSGQWAAATVYGPGVYVRNAASTKVFLSVTGGTSDAVTEPTSASPGALVPDGPDTLVWRYVDTAVMVAASWKTYGVIS